MLFADDISLVIKDKYDNGVCHKLSVIIPNLSDWFSANNLLLNVEKTQTLKFGLGSRSQKGLPNCVMEKLEELSLSSTEHIKFLGIWIDTKLTWAAHIKEIAKKLSSATYAIKKIKELGGVHAARDTYFAYFHSIMTYGIIFWGISADAKRIYILQKRALRYILGLKQRDSCRNKFKEIGIMTAVGEFMYQNIMYARENIECMTLHEDVHNYNTRHKKKYCYSSNQAVEDSKKLSDHICKII